MCTVVILRRPDHRWPVLIGANRDEMIDRPWRSPDRHWPDRPEVVAGLDVLAGGSWLGINDWGVAAAVLNRTGSLGPAPDRRSRGELVLEALDHADAVTAAEALSYLDPARSEEHTSELQSLRHLVCRLLLEKKKKFEVSPFTKKKKKRKQ